MVEYLPALGRGLLTTAEVAVFSIAGCALVSLVLGVLRSAKKPSYRVVSGGAIEFFRGASALVFLFWVYYALPLIPGMPQPSPLIASIVVLTLVGGAYGAEIVRSGIEAVARGQSDACHALGLSRRQAMSRVIVPQALSQIVPAFSSLAVDMVKWTSIVSFVGVPDVLYVANAVRSTTFESLPVFCILAAMYAALCFAVSLVFLAIERALPLNRALRSSGSSMGAASELSRKADAIGAAQ